MLSITFRRSLAALAVVVGLLAAAGPASAQGGGADFTRLVTSVSGYTLFLPDGTPVRMARADYCATGSSAFGSLDASAKNLAGDCSDWIAFSPQGPGSDGFLRSAR